MLRRRLQRSLPTTPRACQARAKNLERIARELEGTLFSITHEGSARIIAETDCPGGEELFVLSGELADAHGAYGPGDVDSESRWLPAQLESPHEARPTG